MKVTNVHQQKFKATAAQVGALIDSLAARNDHLWPYDAWPRMKFDRPLAVGATGGHGPIRYFVARYETGRSIRFQFLGSKGFDGFHGYEVIATGADELILQHTLEMKISGFALFTWPLVFRPLHDALIEDSLTRAARALDAPSPIRPWSLWVKLLRLIMSGGKASRQKESNE
jgi:hypothetical protein